ncbi:hypothetical protein B0H13DRAFT_2069224 [Mycena leptocephala]|nr:hypothetical protein B0H13DRAFT_2069224 [Mycena leptocephala]
MSPRGHPSRRTSRRSQSLSSERTMDTGAQGEDFEGEFQEASEDKGNEGVEDTALTAEPQVVPAVVSQQDHDLPFEPAPSPLHTWSPGFQTQEEALDAVNTWAYSVMEFEPCMMDYDDLVWNQAWLKRAILVFDDPCTMLRLKALAASLSLERMEDVLMLALRFGMKFGLYIKMREAEFFRDPLLTPLARSTLGSLFTPGYVDAPMKLSANGPEAQYVLYEGGLYHLLAQPEATAFLYAGGVLKFVAEVYSKDLAHRLVKGPSAQVTEFQKGKTLLITQAGEPIFYTTDQVSNSEISILLGHIPGEHPGTDTMLWPSPAIFERYSTHMRGYVSSSVNNILEWLRRSIVEDKCYIWRTHAEWREFFRVGAKGKFAPSKILSSQDFADGQSLLNRCLPVSWQHAPALDIELPERVITHSPSDL